jgi:hypothetical protein
MHKQEPKDKSTQKPFWKKYIRGIQDVFSLGYLLLILLGMLHEFLFFRKFGLNVFDYYDIIDFLLVPLKNAFILLFFVSLILLSLFLIALDEYWERKHPSSYRMVSFGLNTRPWWPLWRQIQFVLIVLLYTWFAAKGYAHVKHELILQRPENRQITIDFLGEGPEKDMHNATKIGQNKDFLFILPDSSNRVLAIPLNSNILTIEEGKIKSEEKN